MHENGHDRGDDRDDREHVHAHEDNGVPPHARGDDGVLPDGAGNDVLHRGSDDVPHRGSDIHGPLHDVRTGIHDLYRGDAQGDHGHVLLHGNGIHGLPRDDGDDRNVRAGLRKWFRFPFSLLNHHGDDGVHGPRHVYDDGDSGVPYVYVRALRRESGIHDLPHVHGDDHNDIHVPLLHDDGGGGVLPQHHFQKGSPCRGHDFRVLRLR